MIPFDWSAWRREADRYHEDPAALARAPLLDVCKLLTLHVRADRSGVALRRIQRRFAGLDDPRDAPEG